MSISFESVSVKYLAAKKLSGGTRKEYKSTITKWTAWGERSGRRRDQSLPHS